MTLREIMVKKLDAAALMPDEIEEILSGVDERVSNNWNRSATGLPPMVANMMWLRVKKDALAWMVVTNLTRELELKAKLDAVKAKASEDPGQEKAPEHFARLILDESAELPRETP